MKPYTAWSADGRSVVVLDEVHPNMLVEGAGGHQAPEVKAAREARALELIELGVPTSQVATRTGFTDVTIRHLADRAGISRRRWRGWSHEDDSYLLRARANGTKHKDIARVLKRSIAACHNRVRILKDNFGGSTADGADAFSPRSPASVPPSSPPSPAVEAGPSALTGQASPRREASLQTRGASKSASPIFSGGSDD